MSCLRHHVGPFGSSAAVLAAVWWAAGAAEVVVAQSVAVPVTGVAQVAGPANKGTPAPAPVAPPIYPQIHLRQPSHGYRSVPLASTPAESRARAAIEAALAKVRDEPLEFNEKSLREVLAVLGDNWEIDVHLDRRAMGEAGIDPETTVTFDSKKSHSLVGVLTLMLEDLHLDWVIRGERLVVTTGEKAAERLTTRLYPIPWGAANPPVDSQSLVDTITNTIGGPPAWADYGGNGMIRGSEAGEPLLIVMQTEAIHRDIEALLRGMHERGLAEFLDGDGQPRRTPVVKIYRCTDKEARGQLVAGLADLCNESLADGADPAAKVSAMADSIVVRSSQADFHALAAQFIAATVGVVVPARAPEVGGFPGGSVSPPGPPPAPQQAGFGIGVAGMAAPGK